MAVQYKYNPYAPQYMQTKKDPFAKELTDKEKAIKSLESQKLNLEKRLKDIGGGPDTRNFLEKALNLKQDQSFLMDFIEVINRPLETVKGFISGTVDDDITTNPYKEAIKGFTGERGMTSFTDTIAKHLLNFDDQDITGGTRFVLDLAGDIALDPLTYVPAGTFSKALKKVMKFGSAKVKVADVIIDGVNNANKIINTAKQVDNLGKATAEAVEAQGRILTKKAFQKKLDAIEAVAKSTKKLRGGISEVGSADYLQDMLRRYAKEFDLDPNKFYVMLEGTEVIEGTTRKVKDIAIYYQAAEDQIVRLTRSEAKKIVGKKGAFATSTKLDLTDIDAVLKGVAMPDKPSLGRQFLESVKDIDIRFKGQKPKKLVKYLKESIQKGTDETLGILNDLDLYKTVKDSKGKYILNEEAYKKVTEGVKQIFFDDLVASGVGHITFDIGLKSGNQFISLTIPTAKKYLSFTGRIASPTGKKITKGFRNFFKEFNATAAKVKGKNLLKVSLATTDAKQIKEFAEGLLGKADFTVDKVKTTLKSYTIDKANNIIFEYTTKDVGKKGLLSNIVFKGPEGKILTPSELFKIDESAEVLSNLIKEQAPKMEEFSLLDRISSAADVPESIRKTIPYLTPAASLLRDSLTGIKKAFNAKYKITKEVATKISKIGGKKQAFVNTKLQRMLSLLDDLPAGVADAKEKVFNIIESGATLTKTGYRSVRKYSPADFFKDIRIALGGKEGFIFLPEFADEISKKNFLTSMNKAYRSALGIRGNTKIFDVIQVGGSYRLKLTSKFDPEVFVSNFKKIMSSENIANKTLDFGKIAFDDDTLKFWRENEDLIKNIKDLRDELTATIQEDLGFYGMAEIFEGKQGYLPHMLTEEALKAKQGVLPAVRDRFAVEKADFLKGRKYPGTAAEINRAYKAFYDTPQNLFDLDIQNGLENMIEVVSETMEQHEMLDLFLKNADENGKSFFQVIDNTQEAAAVLGQDFKVLKGGFKAEFPKMYDALDPRTREVLERAFANKGFGQPNKAQALQSTAYNYMKKLERAYVDLPSFIKTYDKFLNTWKSVTLITPGYHSKNFLGNGFNSYLSGMGLFDQFKYYPAAFKDKLIYSRVGKSIAEINPQSVRKTLGAQRVKELAFRGIPLERIDLFDAEDLIKLGIKDVDARAYKRMYNFMESGASQSHRGVRDLESVKLKNKKGKNLTQKVVRFNYNAAEAADDFQRYALYRWQYDKTYKSALKEGLNKVEAGIKASGEATEKVAEALFDYSHLTSFEQEYMKRLFPFYTFFKNNLIFQTKNILKRPGQYARVGRAYKGYVESVAGMEVDDMPDYMAENMWLPIPIRVKRNDKDAIAFLKTNLPMSDYLQFVENPFREGANFVTTPIKLFFELGTGREVFTGRQLDRPIERPQTGVLPQIRDRAGSLTLPNSVLQKIAGDFGLRVPMNYLSVILDIADTATGAQSFEEGVGDFMQRMGLVGIQTEENLRLTELYQQLEKLRGRRSLYQTQTGQRLPTQQRSQPVTGVPGLDEYLSGLR